MAEHFDGKGHHRKPRPYAPHNNHGLIKLARLAPLNALPLGSSDDELLEQMVVEMGCADSSMWYVDTAGCAMLQANDAEPPPQRGWLRKAMQCAAVFLLGLMLLAGPTSCKKDPQPSPTPTPNIPTDTITPVTPGDTVTPVNPADTITPVIPGDTILPPVPPIDTIQPDTIVPGPGGDTIVPGGGKVVKFYYQGGDNFTPLDTIRRYANDPEYDSIYIMWIEAANYWTPFGFHSARDSLSKRFNISPKVYGGMTIRPDQIVPDADSLSHGVKGMARCDSVWYADRHYNVWPVNKSAQPPRYNGNRVLKAGRSR